MRERIDVISTHKRDLNSAIKDFESLANLVNQNLANGFFNFNGVEWITPQKSVFLASVLHNNFNETCDLNTRNSYLQTISFPQGLFINDIEDIDKLFEGYLNKNYLPIIKLGINSTAENSVLRNNVINKFINHISELLQLKSNYVNGIRYILSELFDNIFEHSEADFVFLTFQNYPILKKMEICIADVGIGILETYRKNKKNIERDFSDIDSDVKALFSASTGISTKSMERGFGIHTSRNMIADGFKGYALYQSGSALAINDSVVESNCYISGVIFAMIIPYDKMDEKFSIYDYLE